MSFELMHVNRSKKIDSRTSASAKPSHDHINNLPINYHDSIIHLQQTIGNQAVQRLMSTNVPYYFPKIGILQPKLKISQPGDIYEQEADRIAEYVINTSTPVQYKHPLASNHVNQLTGLNGKCKSCVDKEEDERKLEINSDTRSWRSISDVDASKKIAQNIGSLHVGGSPLDESTRAFMESRFGYDFSKVRIHLDEYADASTRIVNALAYTIGSDIFFGAGRYDPWTRNGRKLLAHELTHVVQQRASSDYNVVQSPALNYDPETYKYNPNRPKQSITSMEVKNEIFKISSAKGETYIYRQPGFGDVKLAESQPYILKEFAVKFPEAANLIRRSVAALSFVREADYAGAKFGGYAEDGPAKSTWAYTSGNTVYVPKARTDAVLAVSDFLFELSNAIHRKEFFELDTEAAKGIKGTLTAKEYAYRTLELEVEALLKTGEVWVEMKKTGGTERGKGSEWDQYDYDFFLSIYQAYKEGNVTKDDIVQNALKRKYTTGKHRGKTHEQRYIEQYEQLVTGRAIPARFYPSPYY